MKFQGDLLSLVIPLLNEEGNIKQLLKNIDKALKDFKHEIILVDDFSTDKTVNEIKKISHPKVKLIELRKNYGQSLALAAGFDKAKGDFIITLDGDLQNDPKDILPMLQKLQSENWDVVVGIRNKRKDNFIKKLPSKIANFLIRKATKLHIKDHGCALKVFKKDIAKELNLYGEMHRFISLLAYLNGARVGETNVNHHPRVNGKSKYGLGRTFKVFNDILLILFQRNYLQKPLYLLGNLGIFFFIFGAIINAYLLIEKILGNDIGDRPLLILGVLLLLVGIQLFTTGIAIDLQMRTYYETQNTRPYKVREITNFKSNE
ncbi:glycosyltransferase family 2 protein [Ichthyenterobacterium magnum]|uniref:Glycosyltransferase involved in cell wall biosynthesis n=1 Tax=Ichthyenterobacterium magnum TaxID=1230530 RepID=A0A420DV14_9FLAO|nr:glycosyltransferase family 2 protein [Ichthyenterobacterium magnum]RKE98116.1 glycosyltransferase involved in cell wall biosynthesis [Ichthyenterobacterium magnum]